MFLWWACFWRILTSMSPTILIAGGGTGGHLFPGVAVAETLRDMGAQVSFVGTSQGIEARVVPERGFPFHTIEVRGLKNKGWTQWAHGLTRIPGALWQARKLLRRLRPDVVLGVGGYASGPAVWMASRMGIPTAILEQNSVPGWTNRVLGRRVKAVFTFFPDAGAFFPTERVSCVGNPIRAALLQQAPVPPVADCTRLLVLGGSQGSHAVNELVVQALRLGTENGALPPIQLVHQTGQRDASTVQEAYREMGQGSWEVHPFLDDMAQRYAATDLVIARAGATTLAELTALGLPSLLIPLPTAADDHQTKNALYMQNKGAALLLPQQTLDPVTLLTHIRRLCLDPTERLRMAQASKSLGFPHAAKEVAQRLLSWAARGQMSYSSGQTK